MAGRTAALEAPGATLHYEVQGAGPILLVIPGMPADAGLYAGLVRRLAGSFTVVVHDPRAMSRSRLHGPAADQLVEVHADDARRVLEAVGGRPTCSPTASPGWSASTWPRGTSPVTVPGDHDAVTRRPDEFAERLLRVLAPAATGE